MKSVLRVIGIIIISIITLAALLFGYTVLLACIVLPFFYKPDLPFLQELQSGLDLWLTPINIVGLVSSMGMTWLLFFTDSEETLTPEEKIELIGKNDV